MQLPYAVIRPALDTGDVILFRGKGLISWIIRTIARSRWSHGGRVLKIEGRLFLWESTTLGTGKKGVQVNFLRTRIAQYKGRVAVRRLFEVERGAEMRGITDTLLWEMRDVEYEKDILELLGAALFWRNQQDLSSVFCTELLAEWDIRNGILPKSLPSNEYTPADYDKGGLVDRTMLKGRYGNVIFLKV